MAGAPRWWTCPWSTPVVLIGCSAFTQPTVTIIRYLLFFGVLSRRFSTFVKAYKTLSLSLFTGPKTHLESNLLSHIRFFCHVAGNQNSTAQPLLQQPSHPGSGGHRAHDPAWIM